jgi:hypothetical protein
VAILAIALIFVGVALYAAKSSWTLVHARGQETDETGLEEKERKKMAE